MSAVLTSAHVRRYAVQLALGLAVGVPLGLAIHPAHAENAASLLANPKRLDEVQRGCKTNTPWATEALCREAAQAIRLRFQGRGVPYTPHRVEPFPPPEPQTSPAKPKPEAAHRPSRPHPSSIL